MNLTPGMLKIKEAPPSWGGLSSEIAASNFCEQQNLLLVLKMWLAIFIWYDVYVLFGKKHT